MDLDKAIKKRHSTRKFKTTKHANWRDIIKAIEAASLSPLAGNIQNLKFILVIDKEKISQLAQASQQPFIADADYIVAVCSDNSQLTRSYYERGEIYSHQQAGAAIENFLLKIEDLGLASCWIGAFSDEDVKKILQIPDNINVEALLPVGYELGKQTQKTKRKLDHILYFDKYSNKYMKPLRKPEAI